MTTISVNELPDHVGADLGQSRPRQITQEQVDQFADATDDHQWIHVDPERARSGPFGRTIAHGYLSMSLVPALVAECVHVSGARMSLNYGINKVRFTAPVPVGESVQLSAKLNDVKAVEGGHQVVIGFTLSVAGAPKPSAVGEVVYNHYV